jgi:GNAT superfamily N-acetyltransferase
MRIRAAKQSDLAVMRDIERAAGSSFREIGMPEIAEDEPLPAEELARYMRDDHAWVAADDADLQAAYVIAGIVDSSLHIEQVSMHPRAAGRKVGRMLLEHARLRGRQGHRRADAVDARAAPVAARVHAPRPGHPPHRAEPESECYAVFWPPVPCWPVTARSIRSSRSVMSAISGGVPPRAARSRIDRT